MMSFKRPMLAASLLPPKVEHTDANILAAMSRLKYPVLASLKKDGIRALRMNGTLLSRTLKVIPNKSIRERSLILPGGFDLELWNPELPYDQVESIVMSREHKDSNLIQFHFLDWFGQEGTYQERFRKGANFVWDLMDRVNFPVAMINGARNEKELFDLFIVNEDNGAEGLCWRLPNSPYKQGRSTLREQYLVKLSRYVRTELTITDFKEQEENTNSEKRNELGYIKRTTDQSNMLGKNTLGAFVCSDLSGGTVDVGTGVGLTDKLRKEIWLNRDRYVGKQITVKSKPHGMKDKLRHPIFVGFREKGF